MKALLLAGDTTYLPAILPHLRQNFEGHDIDVYALGINIRAVKRGDLPGLFSSAYDVESLADATVMERLSGLPNLVHAAIAPATLSDQHIPWMHQFDLLQQLYARAPKKYTHYLRARFDIVLCEPLRYADDVIVPTRYHHDLELLKQVVSDQFACVPAAYADRFFAFADYYNRFKPEIMQTLREGSYNERMDLIPEFKLREYLAAQAIPINPHTIKAYPYSWLARLQGDVNNAYIRDLPPGILS